MNFKCTCCSPAAQLVAGNPLACSVAGPGELQSPSGSQPLAQVPAVLRMSVDSGEMTLGLASWLCKHRHAEALSGLSSIQQVQWHSAMCLPWCLLQ